MADDDTMPDEAAQEAVGSDDPPVADRGECPICSDEFDDPTAFRDHLGDVHDLYDEEGATTTLWIPTFAVEPVAAVEPTIPEPDAPPAPVAAAKERAPVGLIVFVVLLIAIGGGLVVFMQSDGGSDTRAGAPRVSTGRTPDSATSSTADALAGRAGDSDSTLSPTGESTDGAATSADETPSTHGALGGTVPVTEPAPPSSTAPVTTAPPATFVAPTTTAAQVDSCSRDHGQWIVTYSWRYVGGTGWSPLATYTPIGGGKYQHTVSVPANGNTPITTVGVVDSNGKHYNVALSPTLSADSC